MNFRTKISFQPSTNQIDYQSQVLILGSCFAENMGGKLDYFKYQALQNPFGILFHPVAIKNLISRSIEKEAYTEEDIFFLNERWHCFDAHSDLSDPSKEKLLQKLNSAITKMHQHLTKSSHVLITLGTAWVYRNNKSGEVVSNCHKVPQKEFSKELLPITEIVKSLRNTINLIRSRNEKVQFIFTVSPIRHLKDGFVENQRSKAHLIVAIQQLVSYTSSGGDLGEDYFPSYEILMDELRDYRFYEADMVHPNQLAVDYIWEKFKKVWISPKAYPVMHKVDVVQKGLKHRPFNSDSEQHQQFLASLEEKITYLQNEYPFMAFGN